MSNNRVVLGLDKTKKERGVHLMSVFMSESIFDGSRGVWWTKKRDESSMRVRR